eukprot:UN01429
MSLGGIPYTSKDGVNFSPATSQVNRVLVKLPNKFLANTVGKMMHKYPVWGLSGVLGFIGSYYVYKVIANSRMEPGHASYMRQNPIDPEAMFTHEMNAELHLLLTAPLDVVPVSKRSTWELLSNVEPLYHKMNSYKDPNCPEAKETYKQYLSEAYQVLFERAQARGKITPEQREFQQGAIFAVNDLPQAQPIKQRQFPDVVSLQYINQSVQPPAPDAPREEFVKYYASKYNVDL